MQSPAMQSADELRSISSLISLARLCLSNTPLAKAAPPGALRAACAALCPGLTLLDGVAVSGEERQAAQDADVEGEWCQ